MSVHWQPKFIITKTVYVKNGATTSLHLPAILRMRKIAVSLERNHAMEANRSLETRLSPDYLLHDNPDMQGFDSATPHRVPAVRQAA
jgi:hypothetical protein